MNIIRIFNNDYFNIRFNTSNTFFNNMAAFKRNYNKSNFFSKLFINLSYKIFKKKYINYFKTLIYKTWKKLLLLGAWDL